MPWSFNFLTAAFFVGVFFATVLTATDFLATGVALFLAAAFFVTAFFAGAAFFAAAAFFASTAFLSFGPWHQPAALEPVYARSMSHRTWGQGKAPAAGLSAAALRWR